MSPLKTDRLVLRHLTLDDAESIFDYGQDPDVTRFVSWPTHKTVEDSLSFIKDFSFLLYKKGLGPYGICIDDKLIGTVGLSLIRPQIYELGYCLHKDYWGQGIAVESSKALITEYFSQKDAYRIFGKCDPRNVGSKRVLEKIGMKYEGCARSDMCKDGEWRDSLIFAILKDEWAPVTT